METCTYGSGAGQWKLTTARWKSAVGLAYLKEIAEILGINKRLTTHTARKTFASTILLNNDVPIEIVSKLLGHSSIRVTEAAYAQVMNKNTSRHMNQLKQKLYTEEN